MPIETLEDALKCRKCNATQKVVEEAMGKPGEFVKGECILINCPHAGCERWFYCMSCKKRFNQSNLRSHPKGKRHKDNHKKVHGGTEEDNEPTNDGGEVGDFFQQYTDKDDDSVADLGTQELFGELENALQAKETERTEETVELELASTFHECADESMADNDPDKHCQDRCVPPVVFPRMNMEGNEWMVEATSTVPRATLAEIHAAFADQEVAHMKAFWISEFGCGPGRCGGGLCYLAAKAFQHQPDSRVNKDDLPEFTEAFWQFNNLLQYHSMNEEQRGRQAQLNSQFKGMSFFQKTHVPTRRELSRYYGMGSAYSMYRSLPTPTVRNLEGVAYVPPKAILTYAMANGVPNDDFLILAPHGGAKVVNVEDCRKAREWAASVKSAYKAENDIEVPLAIAVVLWKDGFCYNNCKANRSLDMMTMNCGAPKDKVNGTDNTFPVAIGLKKALGWRLVEEEVSRQFKELETVDKPIRFYNSKIEKIQAVFVKRFVFLADRPEKAAVTKSVSYSGDAHRCFSVSGKVETAKYDVEAITKLQENERAGKVRSSWNWADPYVLTGNRNGAKLPSCKACRLKRLQELMVVSPCQGAPVGAPTSCAKCADWNVLELSFAQHQDYPKHYTQGSPVPAPNGRDIFSKTFSDDCNSLQDCQENLVELPFVKLSFPFMKQACQFAFYQASRKKHYWGKGVTVCYLNYCGVSPKIASDMFRVAEHCRKDKKQDQIEYNSEYVGVLVGENPNAEQEVFHFPSSWSDNLELSDYIETTMHQLGLGIAKYNFELTSEWLKSLPAGSGMSSSGLRRKMQELLEDLKKIRTHWCNPLPFNVSDKKGYTTGGWVADQWFTLTRFSKVFFAWCSEVDPDSKYGSEDLSRMVVSYHALVARCLTHSAIDDDFINETELHLKEFLSCVLDLDVRTRHEKLASASRDKKKTEAWWEKSNYMSLLNLAPTMALVGPLVLWWDGGGKGERYIQMVKPHIKRGVRGDLAGYCVRLLDKLYRVHQLGLLEKRFVNHGEVRSSPMTADESDDEVEELVENLLEDLAEEIASDEDGSSPELMEEEMVEDNRRVRFSTLEEQGMSKARTIHVYRKLAATKQAIKDRKPLSGIVVATTNRLSGKTSFEFQMVFRKPGKQFARAKVSFDDRNGVSFAGMWCSGIQVDFEDPIIDDNFDNVQKSAESSAVALPLRYAIGDNHQNSNKYYVTTNWWKERTCDGTYRLPTLDSSMYYSNESNETNETQQLLAEAASCTRPKKKQKTESSQAI